MRSRGILLVAILGIAGCVAPGTDAPAPDPSGAPADWAERVLSFGEDHDHASLAQHAGLSTPNFEVLGYDPLLSPYYDGSTPAGYLCGDAQPTEDGRRIAVVESRSELGFAVADVTDPAAPKWLGELVMRSTYVYDVAVVPDGKHVLLVTSQLQQEGLIPAPPILETPRIEWRSACGGDPVVLPLAAQPDPIPRPSSLILVSIEDPAEPTIIDQRPLAGYGHSVFSTILDGRTWILAAAVASSGSDSFSFYELMDTPLGAKLALLSTYVPPAEPAQMNAEIGGHDDGWIAKHPITGQTLAYLVNRRDLTILDLADPRAPAELGRWSDWTPERNGFAANMHSVVPLTEAWNGRHYTIIGPEWAGRPEAVPTGIVWAIDTTDPSALREVGGWTLPFESEWDGAFQFSTHYLAVVERTLFVSTYHGGIWAIDLSTLGTQEFVEMDSIGVFLPDIESPKPPETPFRWTPTTEEVLAMPDGSLVTFDSNSGLYTFRFDATRPSTPPAPWPIPRP